MTSITVNTKEELSQAKEENYDEIIIEGTLADDLKKSKKIALASGATLAAITAAIGLAPVTGGMSAIGLAPLVALTGIEIATIIIAASIGLSLILAIYKDYEEIIYENGRMTLRKKVR